MKHDRLARTKNRRNPQDRIPRDDLDWTMAEKPAQEKIQGIEIHFCKTKQHLREGASHDGHIR